MTQTPSNDQGEMMFLQAGQVKRYNVMTYDADLGKYTPEEGMQNLDRPGLVKALRNLRGQGYFCTVASELRETRWDDDGDPSVVVDEVAEVQQEFFT